MSTTETSTREFILVGQCQGTGYTLWDIAPAPTDASRRATVLEELGVDAMDAFGSVNTAHGATAREALDSFLAEMREQSGLDDYGLTADSKTDNLGDSDVIHAYGAASTGTVEIKVAIQAGPDAFLMRGGHPHDAMGYVRIHDGIVAAGFAFPEGTVAVRIDNHRNVTSTLDLATACGVLAAAGEVDRFTLDRTVLLGELRFDGHVSSLPGIADAARSAETCGYHAVVVPVAQLGDVLHLGLDLEVIGVRTLREAVTYLNREA